jgi:hypothetical protein
LTGQVEIPGDHNNGPREASAWKHLRTKL